MVLPIAFVVLVAVASATPSGVWSSEGFLDKTWYSDSKTQFTLTTAKQLAGLQALITGDGKTFSGKTIYLGADIDLGEHYWPTLGTDYYQSSGRKPFEGTFDGNGHEIKNYEVTDWGYVSSGFFASLDGATIKNTLFTGSVTISGTAAFTVGCVAGYAYSSTFINVVSSCDVSVSTTNAATVGGIVGKSASGCSFDNCRNIGTVKIVAASSGSGIAGGIVGALYGKVTNSANTGYVKGNHVGGIAGAGGTSLRVENCFNTGSLDGSRSSTNGICPGSGTYVNCYNSGSFNGYYQIASSASYAYGSNDVSVSSVTQSCSASCGKFDNSGALSAISGSSVSYSTLVDALNGWIDLQSDPSIYNRWKKGEGIPADFSIPIKVKFISEGSVVTEYTRYTGQTFGTLPTVTRQNYFFEGWFTGENGGGSKISSDTVISNPTSFSVYAYWLEEVTVSFNANGGHLASNTITVVYSKTYSILPIPTKYGARFEYWYKDVTTAIVTNDTVVSLKVPHELTALWTNVYHVVFGSVVERDYDEGQQLGSLPDPGERAGYEFIGWFDSDTDVQVSETTLVVKNLTLTPRFLQKVTVTFNYNGGQSSFSQKTFLVSRKYGSLPFTSKTGHTFDGWFTSSEGGEMVTNDTIVVSSLPHTLHAHWTVNVYTLSFEVGKGSAINAVLVPYGVIVNPDDYETSRDGFVFAGWFIGNTPFTASPMPDHDVVLTAHWGVYVYINFNPCAGPNTPAPLKKVSNSAVGQLPIPVYDGYAFVGWFTQCGTGTEITPSSVLGEGNITVYAHWTLGTYYIIFDTRGGEQLEPMPFLFQSDISGLPLSVLKENSAFIGWYADSEVSEVFSLKKMPSHNVTVYAKWDVGYKITFNANGGSVDKPYFYIGSGMTFGTYGPLPIPSKDGHTFNGWFTEPTQGVQVTEETEFYSNVAITLYAHWTINKYVIKFNTNGGSAVNSITYEYGAPIVLLVSTEKDGYAFGGWYLDSLFLNVMNIARMPSYNITLYAKWIKSFKCTLNPTGGTCDKKYLYLATGMEYGYYGGLPTPAKTGNTFLGWYTEAIGGTMVSDSTQYMYDRDITLYAHWSVNTYVIAYNTNGGTSVPSQSLEYGSVITTPTNVQKQGHIFDGWFLDSGLVYPMNYTTMPATDLVLYARWKDGNEKDALDYADVIFGSIIGGVIAIAGAIYTVLACCCRICKTNAACGKANIFNKCEWGRARVDELQRDEGGDVPMTQVGGNNSSTNSSAQNP